MATTTPKKLYGGTLSTSAGTVLYTVPALTTTVVTGISLCNTSAAATTVTLTVDGMLLLSGVSIYAEETWLIGPQELRQVLATTTTITASAGAAASIDCRISGAEIT